MDQSHFLLVENGGGGWLVDAQLFKNLNLRKPYIYLLDRDAIDGLSVDTTVDKRDILLLADISTLNCPIKHSTITHKFFFNLT